MEEILLLSHNYKDHDDKKFEGYNRQIKRTQNTYLGKLFIILNKITTMLAYFSVML